jgi:hypothetical protein
MTVNEDQEHNSDTLDVVQGILNGCLLVIPIWLGIISIAVVIGTIVFIILR